MKNALKLFKNEDHLKLDVFETDALRGRFHEVADVLLNYSILKIKDQDYRICEIEFYVRSESHQDPYTHCHPEQLQFGGWYFHRTSQAPNATYKGGNYKGVDLTLGDGENFAGVLIRRIECVASGHQFDGPSLVVDEILRLYGVETISNLMALDHEPMQLVHCENSLSRQFFMSPRVGLNAKLDQPTESFIHYMFMLFRYATGPRKTRKGKALLFLYQANLYGLERAIEDIGIR
ncbi:MAG: hypothetical protein HC883_02960, partial [Bdellovibrionaceae bacterium]|nr:hypothetical protein [Pseudobdellovibrionaceae bacterium]